MAWLGLPTINGGGNEDLPTDPAPLGGLSTLGLISN
jgi:hypothetical protein